MHLAFSTGGRCPSSRFIRLRSTPFRGKGSRRERPRTPQVVQAPTISCAHKQKDKNPTPPASRTYIPFPYPIECLMGSTSHSPSFAHIRGEKSQETQIRTNTILIRFFLFFFFPFPISLRACSTRHTAAARLGDITTHVTSSGGCLLAAATAASAATYAGS